MLLRRLLTGPIRGAFWRVGWDLLRVHPQVHSGARRARLLQASGIDVVLDVGANIGQFAGELRKNGYRGRIVSFEPLEQAFRALSQAAARDGRWIAEHTAIGAEGGTALINVSKNLASSSFLEATPMLVASAPTAAFVTTETVRTARLEAMIQKYVSPSDKAFLKIDVQGFELVVLASAGRLLDRICLLQIETALQRTYRGQPCFREVLDFCETSGFSVVGVEPGFTDAATGKLLELDLLLARDAESTCR